MTKTMENLQKQAAKQIMLQNAVIIAKLNAQRRQSTKGYGGLSM